MKPILLCTDLDRTLLPNGLQAESPAARQVFAKLAASPFVSLAYVSGRNLGLLKEAIVEYQLPIPDFMIGDVGTSIYRNNHNEWQAIEEWQALIAKDWPETTTTDLAARLADLKELTLQEPAKQSPFKLSYYTPPEINQEKLQEKISQRLQGCVAKISLVQSINEINNTGLCDLLPAEATKVHGVRFLIKSTGIPLSRTIYAGDSGNDLEVIRSEIKTILVANASPEIKQQAIKTSSRGTIYLAQGDFLGMNGNYAAGILEGLAHYLPETLPLLQELAGH